MTSIGRRPQNIKREDLSRHCLDLAQILNLILGGQIKIKKFQVKMTSNRRQPQIGKNFPLKINIDYFSSFLGCGDMFYRFELSDRL